MAAFKGDTALEVGSALARTDLADRQSFAEAVEAVKVYARAKMKKYKSDQVAQPGGKLEALERKYAHHGYQDVFYLARLELNFPASSIPMPRPSSPIRQKLVQAGYPLPESYTRPAAPGEARVQPPSPQKAAAARPALTKAEARAVARANFRVPGALLMPEPRPQPKPPAPRKPTIQEMTAVETAPVYERPVPVRTAAEARGSAETRGPYPTEKAPRDASQPAPAATVLASPPPPPPPVPRPPQRQTSQASQVSQELPLPPAATVPTSPPIMTSPQLAASPTSPAPIANMDADIWALFNALPPEAQALAFQRLAAQRTLEAELAIKRQLATFDLAAVDKKRGEEIEKKRAEEAKSDAKWARKRAEVERERVLTSGGEWNYGERAEERVRNGFHSSPPKPTTGNAHEPAHKPSRRALRVGSPRVPEYAPPPPPREEDSWDARQAAAARSELARQQEWAAKCAAAKIAERAHKDAAAEEAAAKERQRQQSLAESDESEEDERQEERIRVWLEKREAKRRANGQRADEGTLDWEAGIRNKLLRRRQERAEEWRESGSDRERERLKAEVETEIRLEGERDKRQQASWDDKRNAQAEQQRQMAQLLDIQAQPSPLIMPPRSRSQSGGERLSSPGSLSTSPANFPASLSTSPANFSHLEERRGTFGSQGGHNTPATRSPMQIPTHAKSKPIPIPGIGKSPLGSTDNSHREAMVLDKVMTPPSTSPKRPLPISPRDVLEAFPAPPTHVSPRRRANESPRPDESPRIDYPAVPVGPPPKARTTSASAVPPQMARNSSGSGPTHSRPGSGSGSTGDDGDAVRRRLEARIRALQAALDGLDADDEIERASSRTSQSHSSHEHRPSLPSRLSQQQDAASVYSVESASTAASLAYLPHTQHRTPTHPVQPLPEDEHSDEDVEEMRQTSGWLDTPRFGSTIHDSPVLSPTVIASAGMSRMPSLPSAAQSPRALPRQMKQPSERSNLSSTLSPNNSTNLSSSPNMSQNLSTSPNMSHQLSASPNSNRSTTAPIHQPSPRHHPSRSPALLPSTPSARPNGAIPGLSPSLSVRSPPEHSPQTPFSALPAPMLDLDEEFGKLRTPPPVYEDAVRM